MILMLSVRLAAAVHSYLDAYAPTNILIRMLRDPGGQRLAFPVSAVLTFAYGLLGAWLTTIIGSGGPGWLNPLALLCAWNTIKFFWIASSAAVHLLLRTSVLETSATSTRQLDVPARQTEAEWARAAVWPVVSVADDQLWAEAPAVHGRSGQS